MSAKTPGVNVGRGDVLRARNRRQQLVVFPPLLVNIGPRASLVDYEVDDQNPGSSLLFGPVGGAMFSPTDPSNGVQPPQLSDQGQGLQSPLSTVAASSSSLVFQLQSLALSDTSDAVAETGTRLSSSTTNVLLTDVSSQTQTSTAFPTTSTQTSNEVTSTSQIQTRSLPGSQTQAGLVAASASSATFTGLTSATIISSALPSLTTSQALFSPSSTSTLQRDFESLPRVAEIVIGIVGSISLIAFLATLGSWLYKQRHRKADQAEITSITSFDSTPPRGFFGCLKKRSGRHEDDMSELGFGLGRVTFFGEPSDRDEHHHVTQVAERGMLGETMKEGKRETDAFPPPQNPFSDHFGINMIDRASSTVRPIPAYLHEGGTVERVNSNSISPRQHLAPFDALGGSSATPLTVANLAPGDTSSDEERHSEAVRTPSSVTRYPSVGTPRIGVSTPRFMNLVEDEALAVPWAPLNIRRNDLQPIKEDQESKGIRDAKEGLEKDMGFEQLQISRASTLSLGMSRTFSQRLEHSLSTTLDWRDGVTKPPPGTFRAAWDAQNEAESDIAMNGTDKNWATTLKKNFYSALNAVGSSIHATSTANTNVDLANPRENPSFVPSKRHVEAVKDPLEDILTPPPARVAAVRLERTKGSILRGNLGIAPTRVEHGTGLGLGLESLSRSSTLSTCWSEAEKEPTEERIRKVRMRVRGLTRERRVVQRSDTSSTASSMTYPDSRHASKASRGRLGVRGNSVKFPSQRPRYSRMPVSQSSMWSSKSFVSNDGGEERR